MRWRYTYYSLVVLNIIFAISSCSENVEPTPYTYTQIFTGKISKTWSMTFIEETENGEVLSRFPIDCTKDDEYIFYATADRLYEFNSGPSKCFSDEPTKLVDNWTFTNSTATLTMVLPIFSSQALPFIVRKVDKDDLTLEIFLDQEGTASYRIYFKLKDEE